MIGQYVDWFGSRYGWTPDQVVDQRWQLIARAALVFDDLADREFTQRAAAGQARAAQAAGRGGGF